MKNRDIYTNALSVLAQDSDTNENSDFEERAPYIIANFCREAFELDKLMRSALGFGASAEFKNVYLPLDSDFPLLDRFAAVGAKYLAAMLIIDENSELSDRLYDMYCDSMASLQCAIPAVIEKITNKYL